MGPPHTRTRQVVVTVDYELFGNGTGDVRRHMIEPAAAMARLGIQYGVPVTYFVEMEEYLAFVRYRAALRAHLGYDPAQLVEEQLVALARDGHDLQLHLHPQWYGARFVAGRWELNPAMTTVDGLFDDAAATTGYVGSRVEALNAILAQAGVSRRVCAYRAGGFCAQPGTRLLQALAAHGVVIDSSVVKGLRRDRMHERLDFTAAPLQRMAWQVDSDVAVEHRGGALWEIPIYSRMGRRFQQLSWTRLKAKFSANVPREKQKEMVQELGLSRNPLQLAAFLLQPIPLKLDYHNLAATTMTRWVCQAHADADDPLDVIVLIGHTKEHLGDRTLDRFMRRISTIPGLHPATFTACAAALQDPKP